MVECASVEVSDFVKTMPLPGQGLSYEFNKPERSLHPARRLTEGKLNKRGTCAQLFTTVIRLNNVLQFVK